MSRDACALQYERRIFTNGHTLYPVAVLVIFRRTSSTHVSTCIETFMLYNTEDDPTQMDIDSIPFLYSYIFEFFNLIVLIKE